MAAQNYDKVKNHRHRVSNYKNLLSTLKYEESWMPMKSINIPKFESANKSFGVNIFTYTEKDKNTTFYKHPNVDIIYRSRNDTPQIYLLLLQNGNIITLTI